MGKITQTLDRGTLIRRPASQSRLFSVDIETGVLRVLFNAAATHHKFYSGVTMTTHPLVWSVSDARTFLSDPELLNGSINVTHS